MVNSGPIRAHKLAFLKWTSNYTNLQGAIGVIPQRSQARAPSTERKTLMAVPAGMLLESITWLTRRQESGLGPEW